MISMYPSRSCVPLWVKVPLTRSIGVQLLSIIEYMKEKKFKCSNCQKPITGRGKTGKCTSCTLLGHKRNNGKSPSLETRRKMSKANRGKKAYNWKGDDVGINALHMWVKRWRGKASKCESKECTGRSNNYEWANISRKYKRDLNDFIQLCVSCHRKYDYTKEQREKLSKRMKGVVTSTAGKVARCNSEGRILEVYDYLSKAAREMGMLHSSISNNIAGRSNLAGGFKWKKV